jgi:hypothetical protein
VSQSKPKPAGSNKRYQGLLLPVMFATCSLARPFLRQLSLELYQIARAALGPVTGWRV